MSTVAGDELDSVGILPVRIRKLGGQHIIVTVHAVQADITLLIGIKVLYLPGLVLKFGLRCITKETAK